MKYRNIYNKNTPEGMRDIIFEDVLRCKDIETRLNGVFLAAGFRQVITPVLEYADVFDNETLSINPENMYKLTETSGKTSVLRADNTLPMARVASTKLRGAGLPLKLFYNQNVYSVNRDYSGRRNEVLQSGIELIGENGIKSDIVAITIAIEALKALKTGFKLEIGHVGYYNSLINELTLDEEESHRIRALVDSKNAVSLDMIGQNEKFDRIRKIPLLFGGSEVLAEAKLLSGGNKAAAEALDYTEALYNALDKAGYGDNILIDLGIVHTIDYYTGTVFRGYIEGAGEPVLTGGRYDGLLRNFGYDVPATGFAVNVGLAADTLSRTQPQIKYETAEYIIHFDSDAYGKAVEYKKYLDSKNIKNELSVFDLPEQTMEYAVRSGIKYVVSVTEDKTEVKAL